MKNDQLWSRRRFSKAVISAQLLLTSGALSLPLSCLNNKNPKINPLLTSSELETLKSAMDCIIPSNDKMPSASEVGGIEYILKILEEFPELKPLFNQLLATIDSNSLGINNIGFSHLNPSEQTEILKQMESTEPDLFKVLKDFTYESYYLNEKVYSLIGYEPHPTGTLGPTMEPFDENLLNRVKDLPPMYTKI